MLEVRAETLRTERREAPRRMTGRALKVISGVKRLNPYWKQEQTKSSALYVEPL